MRGLFRGFFQEIMGLVGLVMAFILATKYMSNAALWVNKVINISPGLATLLGFLLIFFGVVFGFQLLAHLLQKIAQFSYLGWLEKMGGGVVGFLKGATIVSLLILFVSMIPFTNFLIPDQNKSMLFEPAKGFAPKMFNLLIELIPDSKSFYAELKESLDNFSPSELGKKTQKLLESFQNHDPPQYNHTSDDQSH